MMKEMLEFIQNKMPLGVMVFDEKMRVIYQNSIADKFLKRYGIAPKLTAVAGKMFRERGAADKDTLSKDISLRGTAKDMPVNLSVRYLYSEEPYPRISVFISTKSCNSQLNVEEVITRYNLTKKEEEIFRQLARGLKNTDIARLLNMQAQTLRDHLRAIYRKCGVKSKLELVRNIIT
ncbi:MAG: helix-turn-helix transcriptional regulator [Thermodesulfovibrionales bacterium]